MTIMQRSSKGLPSGVQNINQKPHANLRLYSSSAQDN